MAKTLIIYTGLGDLQFRNSLKSLNTSIQLAMLTSITLLENSRLDEWSVYLEEVERCLLNVITYTVDPSWKKRKEDTSVACLNQDLKRRLHGSLTRLREIRRAESENN